MIRINLLPEKKKKKRIKGPSNILLVLIIANLSALLIMGAVTFWFKSMVSQLRAQSESNKTMIADLSKKINEVKKFEKLNKELELKAGLIETLRKNQSVPVRILDEVSNIIPEGVWLNSLAYKDNGVSLEGTAFSNIDIVSFVDNLKRSVNTMDVYLEETREADIEKVKAYRFKINFKVKV